VRDLLGVTVARADELVGDGREGPFDSNANVAVGPLVMEKYVHAAEEAAEKALAQRSQLLPCDPVSGGEACARALVDKLGARAFRRPLRPSEAKALLDLHQENAARGGTAAGAEALIQALLLAPQFLYVTEPGHPTASPAERAYAVASRLSYFLWQSMPDEALFAAAAAGRLGSPDELRAQAHRMLADARGQSGLAEFLNQWTGLGQIDHIEKVGQPSFDAALRTAMRRESERFFDHLVRDKRGTISELFTANYSFVDSPLLPIYGLAPRAGVELARTELDPAQRKGLLTHPGLLAVHADAETTALVLRGRFIRDAVLCGETPLLPQDVDIDAQKTDEKTTPRQLAEQRLKDPQCGGCHRLMDPIGIAFDAFDVIGRYRTEVRGARVDLRGEVVATRALDGKFEGFAELIDRLAGADEVRACVALQISRYALGRAALPEWECWRQDLARRLGGGDVSLGELVVEIAASPMVTR
jgi:hypothetical protein